MRSHMRQSRCSDEYGEDSDWPEDEGVMDQPDDEIEDELEGEFLSDDPESGDPESERPDRTIHRDRPI